MPELPEVETVAESLRGSAVIAQKITDIEVFWPKSINASSKDLQKQLIGQHIKQVSRRGKWLLLTLDTIWVLVHLRMTGKLAAHQQLENFPHERIRLHFGNHNYLSFIDPRKFGRLICTQTPNLYLQKLGPDPLSESFTIEKFAEQLKRSMKAIKAFLLDQSRIAGLGNIYVDEVLWQCSIHPAKPTSQISSHEFSNLFTAIQSTLTLAIANKGSSLGQGKPNFLDVNAKRGSHQHFLNVYGKKGLNCPRCQQTIQRIVLFSRGTHICPSCQAL